jgi:hypothetical protein
MVLHCRTGGILVGEVGARGRAFALERHPPAVRCDANLEHLSTSWSYMN